MSVKKEIMKKRTLAWLMAGALFITVIPTAGAPVMAAANAGEEIQINSEAAIQSISLSDPLIYGANKTGAIYFSEKVSAVKITFRDEETKKEFTENATAGSQAESTYWSLNIHPQRITTYTVASVTFTDASGKVHTVKNADSSVLSKVGTLRSISINDYLKECKANGTTVVRLDGISAGKITVPEGLELRVQEIETASASDTIDIKVEGTLKVDKLTITKNVSISKATDGKIISGWVSIEKLSKADGEKYLDVIEGDSTTVSYLNIETDYYYSYTYVWSEDNNKWEIRKNDDAHGTKFEDVTLLKSTDKKYTLKANANNEILGKIQVSKSGYYKLVLGDNLSAEAYANMNLKLFVYDEAGGVYLSIFDGKASQAGAVYVDAAQPVFIKVLDNNSNKKSELSAVLKTATVNFDAKDIAKEIDYSKATQWSAKEGNYAKVEGSIPLAKGNSKIKNFVNSGDVKITLTLNSSAVADKYYNWRKNYVDAKIVGDTIQYSTYFSYTMSNVVAMNELLSIDEITIENTKTGEGYMVNMISPFESYKEKSSYEVSSYNMTVAKKAELEIKGTKPYTIKEGDVVKVYSEETYVARYATYFEFTPSETTEYVMAPVSDSKVQNYIWLYRSEYYPEVGRSMKLTAGQKYVFSVSCENQVGFVELKLVKASDKSAVTPTQTPGAEPTQAPGDAPAPTQAPGAEPTQAPAPAQTPGDAPAPTQAPAPAQSTAEPTQAPAATAEPTQAPSGNETGTNPATVSVGKISGLKAKVSGKNVKVSWKKAKDITGYELQYTTDKKFKKGVKKVTVKKANSTSTTIKKLKKGTYYIKIRAYKKDGKSNTFGAFSKAVKFVVK